MLDSTLFNQISFGNSDRAAYSDLNPDDGGQSLYPMSTVLYFILCSILLDHWLGSLWFQLEDTVLLIGTLLLFDPVLFPKYEA